MFLFLMNVCGIVVDLQECRGIVALRIGIELFFGFQHWSNCASSSNEDLMLTSLHRSRQW